MGKLSKKAIEQILGLLDKEYGKEPVCYLNYKKDYELLFATIMAAQCADEVVNEVTKKLFKKYNTLNKYANANIDELQEDIRLVGLFKAKAKNIKETANILLEKYNGKVPNTMIDLTNLPGVGRKTASIILTHLYNIESIAVDTHVMRVSHLIGFSSGISPLKTEKEIMEILPKENWCRINSQLVALGRTNCRARKKRCNLCFLNTQCLTGKQEIKEIEKQKNLKKKQRVIKIIKNKKVKK